MRKPRVFIGSAAESIHIADAIQLNLDHTTEPLVWRHGYELTHITIDQLLRIANSVDFAIFVFSPDDIAFLRRRGLGAVRDNVVFQLGLFTGALGTKRCFIVKPRDTELYLPTDLLDLISADFNCDRSDGDIPAAINYSCTLIRTHIGKLGLFEDEPANENKVRPAIKRDYTVGDVEYLLLSALLKGFSEEPNGTSFWGATEALSGFDEGIMAMGLAKLTRLGLVAKSIADCGGGEKYFYAITPAGVDYLLEHEDDYALAVKSAPAREVYTDDDMPF